jgi:glycosyltransferase involved in cell wall biosynthesis
MGGLDRFASPFSVGVLGRIADWKGQDVLIRALAEPELAEIGARAVIAGDAYPGEEAPDIAALAHELGVKDRVEFLGFRPDPEAVLASVDVVAVPSTRPDPLPNSALEALAARRPVVAADHGGLTEIVKQGETGILVPPSDPSALAKALRELADDPQRRTRMGQAAAADARARFGIPRMLDEIETVYARLGIERG